MFSTGMGRKGLIAAAFGLALAGASGAAQAAPVQADPSLATAASSVTVEKAQYWGGGRRWRGGGGYGRRYGYRPYYGGGYRRGYYRPYYGYRPYYQPRPQFYFGF